MGNPDENGGCQEGMIGKRPHFKSFNPHEDRRVDRIGICHDSAILSVAGCKRVIPPLR